MSQLSDASNMSPNLRASAGGEGGNNETDSGPGLPEYHFSPDSDNHHVPRGTSDGGNQSSNLDSQSTAVSHPPAAENPVDPEMVDAAAVLLSMAGYQTLELAGNLQNSQEETLGGSTLVGSGHRADQGSERTSDNLGSEGGETLSPPDVESRAAPEPVAPAVRKQALVGHFAPPFLSMARPQTGSLAVPPRNQYTPSEGLVAASHLLSGLNPVVSAGSVPVARPEYGGNVFSNPGSSGQNLSNNGNNPAVAESSPTCSQMDVAAILGAMTTNFQTAAAETSTPPQTGTPTAPTPSPITPIFTPNIRIEPTRLPDANFLAAVYTDPKGTLFRRLATYQSFSTAGDFIQQNIHPVDIDLIAPPTHNIYVIKTMSTIKCDECGDKLSRGGELYQCKTCSAQICQTCVEERLRAEESSQEPKLQIGQDSGRDAGDQQAPVDNSLLSHDTDQTDPNDSKPTDSKFVWQSYRKHMAFKLVYVDRKAKKHINRGPWEGSFAVEDYAGVAKTTRVRLVADTPRGDRPAGNAGGVTAGPSKLKLRVSDEPTQPVEGRTTFLDEPRQIRTLTKEERAEKKRKDREEWKAQAKGEQQNDVDRKRSAAHIQDSALGHRPETLKKMRKIESSAGFSHAIPPRLLTSPVVGARFEGDEAAGFGTARPQANPTWPPQPHGTNAESGGQQMPTYGQGFDRTSHHQQAGQRQVQQTGFDQGGSYQHVPDQGFLGAHNNPPLTAHAITHVGPQGAPTIAYPGFPVNYIYRNSFNGESGNPNVPPPGGLHFDEAGEHLQRNLAAYGLPQLRKYLPIISHVNASYAHPGVFVDETQQLVLGSSRSFIPQGTTEHDIPVSLHHSQLYVNLIMADPRFNSGFVAAERTRAAQLQNLPLAVQVSTDNNYNPQSAAMPTEPTIIDSDSDEDLSTNRDDSTTSRGVPGHSREVAGARRSRRSRSRSPARNELETRARINRNDRNSTPPHIRAARLNLVPQTAPILPVATAEWHNMMMRTHQIRNAETRAGRPLPPPYQPRPAIPDPFAFASAPTLSSPASAPPDQDRFAYPGTNPRTSSRSNEDPLFITLPIRSLLTVGGQAINYFPDDDGVSESLQLLGAVAVPELQLYSPLNTAGMPVRYAYAASDWSSMGPAFVSGAADGFGVPSGPGPVFLGSGTGVFGGGSASRPVSFGGGSGVSARAPVVVRASSAVPGRVVSGVSVGSGEEGEGTGKGKGKVKGKERAVEEEEDEDEEMKEEEEAEGGTSPSPGPTGLGLVPGRLRSGKEFQ